MNVVRAIGCVVCLNTMRDVTTYLSLGTNLGDRLANLAAARSALEPLIHLTRCSSIYETTPWGVTDQPDFLNQVVQAQTRLHLHGLLSRLKSIEVDLGRLPTFHYGPRLIDIDILLYADWVIDSPVLTIPHAHLTERAFVLVPLTEIAPDLCHPVTGELMAEVLTRLDLKGISLYQARN